MPRPLIKLAKGLTFDLSSEQILADGFRCQIMGESGSGKSSTAANIAVQVIQAKLPGALLDPHGEYSSLRAAGPNVILVGYRSSHSEPLYAAAGSIEHYLRLIEKGKFVIFNLSEWIVLDRDSLDIFIVAFLKGLYMLRMRCPALTLLLAEEVQHIAPLQPLAGESEKIHTFVGIMTDGRKFGLQTVLCSQAPALVNARGRAACNVRIYLRITDSNDWKNGIRPYIPDDLNVVYKLPKRPEKDVVYSEIRKFPSGYAVVLSRWHEDQLIQLDRPGIAPNKVVPSVLV